MEHYSEFPTLTRENIEEVSKDVLNMLKSDDEKFFSLSQVFSGYGHVKITAFINEYHYKNLPKELIRTIKEWSCCCVGNSDHLIAVDEYPVEGYFLSAIQDALEEVMESQKPHRCEGKNEAVKIDIKSLNKSIVNLLAEKADECGIDVKSYLEGTDYNYCILQSNGELVKWRGSNNDYVVYGSLDEANNDAKDDDKVITETEAIIHLNKSIN